MEGLGIDPLLIGVQIINFGLLLFILKKVLYKPLLSTLKARTEKIDAIEKDKQELEKEQAEFETKQQKLMLEAQKQKKELLLDAKRGAETTKKEAIAEAQKTAKEIIAKATTEAEKIKEEAQKSVREEALILANAIATKVLSEALNADTQEKAVEEAIKKLSKVNL